MLLTVHGTLRLAVSFFLAASFVGPFSFCNAASPSSGSDPSLTNIELQAVAPTAPPAQRSLQLSQEINEEHLTSYTKVLALATIGLISRPRIGAVRDIYSITGYSHALPGQ
jgi:hypothetical protein